MIELESVKARAAPLGLGPWTAQFQAGSYALLGAAGDSVGLALGVISGRLARTGGRVTVLGGSPRASATRRAVAHVSLDATWPDALRVEEALHVASTIRGEPVRDAALRLREFGLEALARRTVRSLSREEVRAVAMTEALTSSVVRVVLIEEPMAVMDARAAAVLPDALRRKSRDGACIIVATASTVDARNLAEEVLVFERGVMRNRVKVVDPWMLAGARGFELHVTVSDPRALVAALADEAGISEIATRGSNVVFRGPDMVALSRAVGRGAAESGLSLESMRLEPLALEDMRLRGPVRS